MTADGKVYLQLKKRTNRPFVLASIMLSNFLGAIEGTIVSTAMPAIVGDLGGFSLYSWVFSSYLLMTTVTVLIYGKLADLYGRKPVILFGIVLFLAGSVLCGFSGSMEMLIFFRFLQGVGAGAIAPITTTIVGDLYKGRERGKVQGYLSSVWGISAIIGPAAGGFLVAYMSWNYVFWLNVPLGILAYIGFAVFFHEEKNKEKQSVDYFGVFLLMVSISALMIVLVEGGSNWGWLSIKTVLLFTAAICGLILFVYRGFQIEVPIIPLKLWREKSIFAANIVSFLTGAVLIGISSYLPAYIQGIMGKTPMIAGFSLTAMSIGWPIASAISGRIIYLASFKRVAFIGSILLVMGSFMFIFLSPDSGPGWAAVGSFLIGLGMGATTTSFIVSIQTSVNWEERGIATALNLFMRNFGNTLGSAFLGGILNSRLLHFFKTPTSRKHSNYPSIPSTFF